MKLHEIKECRATKIAEMRALGDDLSGDKATRFDALETEVRVLDGQIKRAATLAEMERQAEAAPDTSMNRELRSYSVAKAIQESSHDALTGVEAEMHAELSKGRETRGVMIPTSVLLENRAQFTAPDAAGGYAVATQLGGMIDRLRPTMAVQGLGATVLSGLVGFLDLPKLTDGPLAYWIGEDDATTESSSTFGKISMTPKTVSGEMQLSRRLMLQNAVALEDVLRRDLGFVLAQALDKAAIEGSGVGAEPMGIINAVTEDASTATIAQLSDLAADLISALELDDVTGTGAFLTNPALMKVARKIKDGDGHVIPLSEIFHGETVKATTQVSAISTKNPLIYGQWSDLVIGYWSGVDILTNPYHSDVASKGGVKLHAFLDADVAVRHNEAFAWKAI